MALFVLHRVVPDLESTLVYVWTSGSGNGECWANQGNAGIFGNNCAAFAPGSSESQGRVEVFVSHAYGSSTGSIDSTAVCRSLMQKEYQAVASWACGSYPRTPSTYEERSKDQLTFVMPLPIRHQVGARDAIHTHPVRKCSAFCKPNDASEGNAMNAMQRNIRKLHLCTNSGFRPIFTGGGGSSSG